jgi:hypothetical protein
LKQQIPVPSAPVSTVALRLTKPETRTIHGQLKKNLAIISGYRSPLDYQSSGRGRLRGHRLECSRVSHVKRKRVIPIRFGEVGHALFFDEETPGCPSPVPPL